MAPRGRKAAKSLASWIEDHDVRPELVICSPALRATETLGRILASLGSPEVIVEEGVYHAAAGGLLERARTLPDSLSEVAFVGHNPGLADLCLLLARPSAQREQVAANLPTGALATLELDAGSWGGLEPEGAELVRVVFPRDL